MAERPMTEPIIIRSYSDLIEAMRTRVGDLGLSYKSVDEIIDWAPGYTGKILGPTPTKSLSAHTIFSMLMVCGFAIELRPDDEMARAAQKAIDRIGGVFKRDSGKVRTNVRMHRLPWLISSQNAGKMLALRMAKLSPKQRSRLAKRAAKKRWQQHRLAKRKLPEALT